MTQLFVSILNGSITAGWVVLGILLLRLALRKTPKWILCSLWALVGLRLLWPSTLSPGHQSCMLKGCPYVGCLDPLPWQG